MKNLLPVDVDFSKLEARLWSEKKLGVEGGKDRREGGCVRCLRRKVFRTAAVGKGRRRRRRWAMLNDCMGPEHMGPRLPSAARGLVRHEFGFLWSQNCAGSVGWKTKWANELRILEK